MQHKERAVKVEEEVQPITRSVTKAPVKTEADDETPKPYNASALKCRSNGCGRSRQNLSEEMCEELSKKAADLAYENENLRRVSKSAKPDTKEPVESPKPSQIEMSHHGCKPPIVQGIVMMTFRFFRLLPDLPKIFWRYSISFMSHCSWAIQALSLLYSQETRYRHGPV